MKTMLALAIAATGLAGQVEAEVIDRWDDGFVVRHGIETSLGPDDVWTAVISPAGWWSAEHTWSGDAANLTLEARPGGCWCETLPGGGGARHGTVAMAWPGRRLVVDASLGPLMGLSSGGWLTVELEPRDAGATLTVIYRVEGHGLGALADPVDGVIGEQARRLGERLARRS